MELPIERYRDEIIAVISRNPVTIIVGETGSGKTTQVPKYLYETGLAEDALVGITEPRRIAAISAAEFVAGQIGCRVGEEVGFQIRFNDSTVEGTRVKFMTDGILLQEAKSDPLFSRYEVLVFDEVHERGLNTDFALGLAKRALTFRSDLKIVVMSATLEAEKFAKFFSGASIINVEGRMYPVEERFMTEQEIGGQEIEALAGCMVEKIHRSGVSGDMLVFMPGEAEIHRVINNLESLNLSGLKAMAVYGNMNPDSQRKIFERVNGRKVVVATNIAETSITIDGIVHVIDSGLIRENNFNPRTGMETLKVVEHSKAGLEQRKGRAGRTQPGICWRLFTKEEYDNVRWNFQRDWDERMRPEYTKPEIQRSDLAGVVLRLLGIGIKDVENFDYVDAPSFEMLQGAIETLKAIGAITEDREITEVGGKILDLPLDPRLGRMIIEAPFREIVAVAAKLSVRDFYNRPKDKEFEADAAKGQFIDKRSDLLTALVVMNAYEERGWDRRWASENFLNWKAIEEALSIRQQIEEILKYSGIELTSIGYHLPKDRLNLTEDEKRQGDIIGKAVLAGFIENLARFGYRHACYRINEAGGEIYIHPSSVLFGGYDARLFISISIIETTKVFARDCQKVEMDWITEVAPQALTIERTEPIKSWLSENYTVYEKVLLNGNILEEKEMPATSEEIARKIEKDSQLVRTDVFTGAVMGRVFPDLFREIDTQIQARIDVISGKVAIILSNPELYGYEGGYGITRKTYKLSEKVDSIKSSYRHGDTEQGEKLLIALEEELSAALGRAIKIELKRLKKAEAYLSEKEQEQKAVAEKENLKAAWQEYEQRLKEAEEKYKKYPGWGMYTFPVSGGLPQDYRGDDGRMYSFDQDFFEVLPEKEVACWGYVTQWGHPAKVALVLEVVKKPKIN